MLDQPDATLPFTVRQGTKETTLIREVVRVNHLSNCLLCHPASFSRTDLVRGAVNQALDRIRQQSTEERAKMVSSLGLPPGLGVPGLDVPGS